MEHEQNAPHGRPHNASHDPVLEVCDGETVGGLVGGVGLTVGHWHTDPSQMSAEQQVSTPSREHPAPLCRPAGQSAQALHWGGLQGPPVQS